MRTKLNYIVVVVVFLANISCANKTSDANANPNVDNKQVDSYSGNFIECKVNGELLRTDNFANQILFAPTKKAITIWGKTEEGIISIVIEPAEGTGTFIIDGSGDSDAGIQYATESIFIKKGVSRLTVTISEIEDFAIGNTEGKIMAIKGTFEGTFCDKTGKLFQITEGKFSSQ